MWHDGDGYLHTMCSICLWIDTLLLGYYQYMIAWSLMGYPGYKRKA